MIPVWFLLSVLTALCFAVEGVWVKRLRADGFRPEFLAWSVCTFTLPILFAALWLQGWPEIKPGFYFPFAMCVVLNTLALICYFRALSYGDLSMVFPLLSLTPAWMLITSQSITGQFPTGYGLAGVLLSTAGCYALGLDRTGPLSPFRNIWRAPGARWALATSVLWSLTGNFDKAAVEASSAMFHPAFTGVGLSLAIFAFSARHYREDFARILRPRGAAGIGVLALIVGVLVVSQFYAVDLTLATYVASVKRSGMVVGVLFGWLILKEPYGARRFLLSLVVMAGLLLLIFAPS